MEDLSIKIITISKDNGTPDTLEKGAILNQLRNKFIKTEKNVNVSELPTENVENIEKQFDNLINGAQSIFNNLSIDSENFDVEEIKFTCTIDLNGSIAILGIGGGIGMQKGVEITLKKKSKNE